MGLCTISTSVKKVKLIICAHVQKAMLHAVSHALLPSDLLQTIVYCKDSRILYLAPCSAKGGLQMAVLPLTKPPYAVLFSMLKSLHEAMDAAS